MELGGHHVGMGDPVALDQLEHGLTGPLVHEDDGVTHVDGGAGEAQDGRVVER